MGLRKKHGSSKKKPAADFGAALAKARQEADHIFKQASHDDSIQNFSASTTARFIGSPPPGVPIPAAEDLKVVSPRSKAAAWAWYQRGGGGGTGAAPEEARNRTLVVVKRSSRFKAEALRVNGSYTAEDTIIKAEQRWDPNKSLFDSFELLCVAKELDKALQQPPYPSSASPAKSFPAAAAAVKDSPGRSLLVSLSCSSPSLLRRMGTAKFSRFIPAPILCISEDDIATSKGSILSKKKSDISSISASTESSSRRMLKRGMSVGSSTFSRISKVIHLLTNTPHSNNPQDLQDEEDDDGSLHHHTHEHFHQHHHHHHHHVN